MNQSDCARERFSSRLLGIIVLSFSLLLAMVGGILLPVFGFFFAAPLLLLGAVLAFAPESDVCRLLHAK
jgi:hypothetical protein